MLALPILLVAPLIEARYMAGTAEHFTGVWHDMPTFWDMFRKAEDAPKKRQERKNGKQWKIPEYYLTKFGYDSSHGFLGATFRLIPSAGCNATNTEAVIPLVLDALDGFDNFWRSTGLTLCNKTIESEKIWRRSVEIPGGENIGSWSSWYNGTVGVPDASGKPQVFFFALADCNAEELPRDCKIEYKLHAEQLNGDEVGVDHPAEPKGDIVTLVGALLVAVIILFKRNLYKGMERTPWVVKMLALTIIFRLAESAISITGLWHYMENGEDYMSVKYGSHLCKTCATMTMATLVGSLAAGYTLVDPEGNTEDHTLPWFVLLIHFCGPPMMFVTCYRYFNFLVRWEHDWEFHPFQGYHGWMMVVADLMYHGIFGWLLWESMSIVKTPKARRFLQYMTAIGTLFIGSFWISLTIAKLLFTPSEQYTVFQITERSLQAVAQIALALVVLSPDAYFRLCYMSLPDLPHGDSHDYGKRK
mmetsp:Transcript_31607/g.57475  ORF Transcript_31607/g.57475 Transcript_31607/m.57475 type:complete len:473 (+) Transcript_31607:101-1519(+)|eukprot:CAMPEP_0197661954 /NCGR_PEP_ID=MMETSP1338-20131121/51767_1 /TAXON_ID=43686 ORGANISM="Pelagodinium beii, Strain RCC1491" /NCGR_SAMPLE_ID=MMETSP1338 /ASSEMBLY_ACC=CAM_ASM_000754 /LENGTH=472 /DNA_ID=CAMNT_0043239609 /DNA_START=101 /DNA_END=1519 /DNA_ORIENTATION=+